MKKWIIGEELLVRWTINRHDLVEIIMNGDMAAYNPADLSRWDVDVETRLRDYAQFFRQKVGVLLARMHLKDIDELRDDFRKGIIQSLIPVLDELLFKIEDVVEYERNHNLQVNAEREKPSVLPETRYFFFKKNVDWEVGFDGEKDTVPGLNGMIYIAHLLQRPGKEVSVQDLYRVTYPPPEDTMNAATAAANELHMPECSRVLKSNEKSFLMKNYSDLQDELKDETDEEKREELKIKIKKLYSYIKDASKQAGIASDNNRRCQANVKKAIDRARGEIRKRGLANLAQHLEMSITPGGGYSYKYKGDILWKFSE